MWPISLPRKRFGVVAAIDDGAQLLAHAVLGDHGPGDLGGALNVVGGAGGDIVQHQRFGHTAAQQDHQLLLHLLLGAV